MPSPSNIIIIKEVNLPEALIKLRSDGIIHVHYHKNSVIDAEARSFMRDVYNEMAPGKKLNYIFTAAPGVTFTREVIESSFGTDSPIASYALIADSIAYRTIANLYIRINRPKVPYKLFATIEDAVEWLHTNNVHDKLLTKP